MRSLPNCFAQAPLLACSLAACGGQLGGTEPDATEDAAPHADSTVPDASITDTAVKEAAHAVDAVVEPLDDTTSDVTLADSAGDADRSMACLALGPPVPSGEEGAPCSITPAFETGDDGGLVSCSCNPGLSCAKDGNASTAEAPFGTCCRNTAVCPPNPTSRCDGGFFVTDTCTGALILCGVKCSAGMVCASTDGRCEYAGCGDCGYGQRCWVGPACCTPQYDCAAPPAGIPEGSCNYDAGCGTTVDTSCCPTVNRTTGRPILAGMYTCVPHEGSNPAYGDCVCTPRHKCSDEGVVDGDDDGCGNVLVCPE